MTGSGALELIARAGFLVKGVVYIVVGALALQVAALLGGRVTGTRGAFTLLDTHKAREETTTTLQLHEFIVSLLDDLIVMIAPIFQSGRHRYVHRAE